MRSLRRTDTTPALADLRLNKVELLKPIPLRERDISEGWLQTLIYANPTVLPAGEVRADAGPLIPIGREVGVQSGRIDCLYISPEGTLTLVETKLWANAEARRQVIAQIIQYAEELTHWTYEDLDRVAMGSTGKGLWDLVATSVAGLDLDQREFHDAVSQKLEHGDFLLLIVGDGIQRGVEKMAAFLQDTPHLHFTLSLVELKLYRQSRDERVLVVPSIVARVQEVERAVVRVTYRSEERPRVEVAISDASTEQPGKRKRQKFEEEEFLELFRNHELTRPESRAVFDRLYQMVNDHPRLSLRFNNGSAAVVYPKRDSKIGETSLLTIGPFGVCKLHWYSCRKNLIKRYGEGDADRLVQPYLDTLKGIFGEDLIRDGISVTRGTSHLSNANDQLETFLNAIATIAREMEERELAVGDEL